MGLQGMRPPTQISQDSMISSTVFSASASMALSTSPLVVKGAYPPSFGHGLHHVGLDIEGVHDGGKMFHQVAAIAQGHLRFFAFIHRNQNFHSCHLSNQ